MKNLYALLLIPVTLLCLNAKTDIKYPYYNPAIKIDTLPTDTLHQKNPIDTFGGIKSINDTLLKPKKDSVLQ